ncbi:hypothetical protein H6777_01920 [Candidatus Nomurabacteria bacterium]|nr:hypothetical protein [Candidatus Nomurabacteria bacterium]
MKLYKITTVVLRTVFVLLLILVLTAVATAIHSENVTLSGLLPGIIITLGVLIALSTNSSSFYSKLEVGSLDNSSTITILSSLSTVILSVILFKNVWIATIIGVAVGGYVGKNVSRDKYQLREFNYFLCIHDSKSPQWSFHGRAASFFDDMLTGIICGATTGLVLGFYEFDSDWTYYWILSCVIISVYGSLIRMICKFFNIEIETVTINLSEKL